MITREEIEEIARTLDRPELAEEPGMVYQVWQDGEITLQKSGDLLWQADPPLRQSGGAWSRTCAAGVSPPVRIEQLRLGDGGGCPPGPGGGEGAGGPDHPGDAVKRFFVLLGETCVDRIEEAPPDSDYPQLRGWLAADVSRPDSYWGHEEDGSHDPTKVRPGDGLLESEGNVKIIIELGYGHDPASWMLVEAPDEESIRKTWLDIF